MLHAVQAYHTAQRLLGGFLSSSEADGGSGNNNDKPPGFFSLKAYRKYFNVDTSVRLMSPVAGCLRSPSPVVSDTPSSRPQRIAFTLAQAPCLFVQDVLSRMLDSVIGCVWPNFLEKIADTADL